MKALGRTAAGRDKVRLEWEVKPLGVPFNAQSLTRSVQTRDTGAPVAPAGSAIPLSEVVGGLSNGTTYDWRVRVLSGSPFFPSTPWLFMAGNAPTEADFRTAGPILGAEETTPVAQLLYLEPIHPNPFAAPYEIAYALPEAASVRLAVYDVLGRERVVLDEGLKEQGRHAIHREGRSVSGARLESGVYFLRLRAGRHEETRKLVWAH